MVKRMTPVAVTPPPSGLYVGSIIEQLRWKASSSNASERSREISFGRSLYDRDFLILRRSLS